MDYIPYAVVYTVLSAFGLFVGILLLLEVASVGDLEPDTGRRRLKERRRGLGQWWERSSACWGC